MKIINEQSSIFCNETRRNIVQHQTDRQTGRQTDRHTDRQIDTQTDRHTHRQTHTDRQKNAKKIRKCKEIGILYCNILYFKLSTHEPQML